MNVKRAASYNISANREALPYICIYMGWIIHCTCAENNNNVKPLTQSQVTPQVTIAPSLRTAAKAACEGQICLRLDTAMEVPKPHAERWPWGLGSFNSFTI